jgi:subfamily B ATP-binding cassette protein MsbA
VGRARPKVENATVLTDRGTLIRGGVAEVFSWGKTTGKTAYARDPEYYLRMRRAGLNAVRIVCFDAWQRTNQYPHWDLSADWDRAQFLEELDCAVQLATAEQMYVLIDYHDIGYLDLDHAMQFWSIVAPRYADQSNVFFELSNEPVAFHPETYTDDDLRKQEKLFPHVRTLAPDTHLVLLTFANTALPLVPENNPIAGLLLRMRGIDWSNASVGIHPYRTLSSKVLHQIQERAPILITELDLPNHAGGLPNLYTSMDGCEYAHQAMERNGISWFGWSIEGPEKFELNFERGVLEDAKAKGYSWEHDHPLPAPFSIGSIVADLFRKPTMRDAIRIMGIARSQILTCMGLAMVAALLDGAMMLSLLPVSTGAAEGSFDFLWASGILAKLRPHVPAAVSSFKGTFLALAIFIFVMGLVKNAAHYGLHLYVSHLYRLFSSKLANAAFRRYLLFGKPFFDKHGAGSTASILDYNHDLLNLLKKLLELISETLIVAIYLAVMLVISWRLTIVSLLVFPAMHFIRQWIAWQTRKPIEHSQARTLRVAARSFEIHRSMPLFRSFTKEEAAAEQHAALQEEIRKSDFRVWLYEGLLPRAQEMTTLAALLLILILAFLVERGQVSAAKLFVFFFISRLALPRLSVYHELELEFAKKMPRVELFLSLFNDNGKYITPPAVRQFPELKDGIYFQELTFAYPDRDPVLHAIRFTIQKGKVTAIVGPSGSGKTTIASLLLRYYDVAPHTISVDGICLREFSAESIRRNIAVVSQEVILFDDTLRENIAFGADHDPSDEEIDRVVRAAALEDVVASLPKGLDTMIGSEGTMLSGGQRQRVALARALLKRAPILILDEATSSLDLETERVVQDALDHAIKGATTIVISHRMATIQRADRIVVMEHGRVVETGNVPELIEQRGRFYKMWQAQRFDWEDADAPALKTPADPHSPC